MPEPQSVTTQQLKSDIDRGRTGDKIDQGYDPGLSALGTDDEAAGTPNTPAQIEAARVLERRDVAQPAEQGGTNPKRGLPAVWLLVGALVVVVLVVLLGLAMR